MAKRKREAAGVESPPPWVLSHPGVFVFAGALLVRLLHLAVFRVNPMFRHPELDPRYYDEWGQRLAAGNWMGDAVFEMSPLYPYFLGAVYTVFGHSYSMVTFLQAILGATTAWLVYRIGLELFGRAPGLVAGALAAVYPVSVYYDIMIMKTSLGLFFAVLALFFVVSRRTPWHDYFAGLSLGAAVLVRDNYLSVAPFLLAGYLLVRDRPRLESAKLAGVVLLGLFTAILPVTFRNYAVSGDLVLTTSGGGEVFYIGNNPEATGLYKAPRWVRADPRFEHEDFRRKAREETGRDLSRAEASRYWFRRGLDWMLDHPGRVAALYLKKIGLILNRVEVADNYTFRFHRLRSPALWAPLDFGVVLALGAVGIFLARRRFRRFLPLLLFAAGYSAGLLPFFYFSRFRVPLTPVFLVFAGVTLVAAWRARGRRDYRALAAGVGAAAAVFAISALPLVPERDYRDFSNPLEKLGVAYLADENPEKALEALRESERIRPDRDSLQFNLGLAYERLGRTGEAIERYERAVALRPGNDAARARLEALRARAGSDLEDEAEQLRRRREAEGASEAQIREEVGDLFARAGARDRAIREYTEAIRLEPGRKGARLKLAVQWSMAGNDAQGLAIAEEVLSVFPLDPEAVVVQTGCLIGLSRLEEARRAARDALAAHPEHPSLLVRLGQIEATIGNREAAIEAFEQALAAGASGADARVARQRLEELR